MIQARAASGAPLGSRSRRSGARRGAAGRMVLPAAALRAVIRSQLAGALRTVAAYGCETLFCANPYYGPPAAAPWAARSALVAIR